MVDNEHTAGFGVVGGERLSLCEISPQLSIQWTLKTVDIREPLQRLMKTHGDGSKGFPLFLNVLFCLKICAERNCSRLRTAGG